MDKRIIYNPIHTDFAEVSLPASKSISNRLLIMQFLSDQKIGIDNLSDATDTILMESLLGNVAFNRKRQDARDLCVLDCESAGTVLRFLAPVLSLQSGKWLLTGSQRMKQRPVKSLCDALRSLGATLEYTEKEGYPPLTITGGKLKGGTVNIDASESSQYITALMLVAPYLAEGLNIVLENTVASRPYIRMTLNLMQQAGIHALLDGNIIRVASGAYQNSRFFVEPDWSSASYWYELCALVPELRLLLKDLKLNSLQGDSVLTEVYARLGVTTLESSSGLEIINSHKAESNFTFNFTDFPDLVPAVAATCAALNLDARLTGLENLAIKESNRLEALYTELSKIHDRIEILGKGCLNLSRNSYFRMPLLIRFQTYNDHRMAMALAPLATKYNPVIIENPHVVKKSYPSFWDELQKIGLQLL